MALGSKLKLNCMLGVHGGRPVAMGAGKTSMQGQTVSAAPSQFGSHQQSCRHWDSENCKYLRSLIQKDYFG